MAENISTEIGANEYELVYIVSAEVDEKSVTDLNERFAQLVTEQNGELLGTDLWGRRNLAFPIRNQFEGIYVLHRFSLDPAGTSEIDRLLRYREEVLRYLLLRTDE
jgi:small subunit ribosomal protein S6